MAALNDMNELESVLHEIAQVPDFYGHKIDSVTYRNGFGDTPLHVVATWGDCRAISVLVAAGADVNSAGETGYTPSHCAVEQNHADAIRLLLSLGAEIRCEEDGLTPIQLAIELGNQEAVNAFDRHI